MNYPRITALVPEGEHFDEAVATVNEGIYITSGHFANIEASLEASAQAVFHAEAARDAAQNQVTEIQAQLATAQQEAANSTEALATANARIAELEAAAAGFSETQKKVIEKPAGQGNSQVHPYTAELNRLRALQGLPPIQ